MVQEFTKDNILLKTPQYHKIKDVVQRLERGGGTENFSGNCISAADIMQHLLSRVGIESEIVECQAALIRDDGKTKDYVFIGYDNASYKGQIDTHVVLITKDENPILIDMSLGHLLPKDSPYIIERVNSEEPGKIAEYNLENINITYFEKKNLKLPNIHQKTLLQRIVNDQNSEKLLKLLRILVMCAVTLGLVNFLLNVILIILRLYDITWV